MPAKVGPKGTVVIEKGIRDRLSIEAGQEVVQSVEGEAVILRFFPARRTGAAYGYLKDLAIPEDTRTRMETDEGLEALIDEATADHFARKHAKQGKSPK